MYVTYVHMKPRYRRCWCGNAPLPGRATCSDAHALQAVRGGRKRNMARRCRCGAFARPKKATCSEKCRRERRASQKVCPRCNARFVGYTKYCCRECAIEAWREAHPMPVCAVCEDTCPHRQRRTCSDECAGVMRLRQARRARTAERAKKRTAYKKKAFRRADKASVIESLHLHQRGRCDVCGGRGTLRGNGTFGLILDHCHTTGEPRALLCMRCNAALGLVKENPSIARALADYAERCVQFRSM